MFCLISEYFEVFQISFCQWYLIIIVRECARMISVLLNLWRCGALLCCSRLQIWCCYCSGMSCCYSVGLTPGLEGGHAMGVAKKKKKKFLVFCIYANFWSWLDCFLYYSPYSASSKVELYIPNWKGSSFASWVIYVIAFHMPLHYNVPLLSRGKSFMDPFLMLISLDFTFFWQFLCGILKNLALEDTKYDVVVIFLNAFLFCRKQKWQS